jgi:GntR family transcriptional regulator, uxu operon transcriptional repressor
MVNRSDTYRELAALIVSRSSRDGTASRLPPERELAVELGVSRSAVRRAMAVLQAEGRISREVGRGTFLHADTAAGGGGAGSGGGGGADGRVGDGGVRHADYAPADVMLVRRMFEPQVMPLVVAWATARDFAEMERCLDGGNHASAYEDFETWDAALHRTIVGASHSPLLVRLYSQVEQARRGRVWGDMKRRSSSPERRAEYQRDHQEIVAALKVRDADGAVAAMRAHLARVSSHLLGAE